MGYFLLRRTLSFVLTLFVVSAVVFAVMNVLPGDPALTILGLDATEDALAALREELSLNEPVILRYFQWVWDALRGDLYCLAGALCWTGIALTARLSRLSQSEPEMILIYQLAVSGPVLLFLAPAFGPVLREVTDTILWIFAFQVLAVVSFGMLVWFMVLRVYPASDMTAFSFLAPLFGVVASWIVLDEPFSWSIVLALVMVGGGIALISWKPKATVAKTETE